MRRGFSFAAMLLTLMNTVTLSTVTLSVPHSAQAQGTGAYNIYTDSLAGGWQNWSWCGVDFGSTDYAHSGASSIKVDFSGRAWAGFALHSDPISTAGYTTLTFWINGGATNSRSLNIVGNLNGNQQSNVSLGQFIDGGAVLANTWSKVVVPLAAISLSNTTGMTGFWLADAGGSAQQPFYIDDVSLGNDTLPTPTPIGAQTVSVDFKANQRAINPGIYGMAYAGDSQAADLRPGVNRAGGNASTKYNWKLNASNRASDYFFESLADGDATPSQFADIFIPGAHARSAEPMITIPMVGYVAKLDASRNKLSSYSVKKYGAQTGYDGDSGNGQLTNGAMITNNDPNDANIPADSTFQQGWAQHMVAKNGTAGKGGLIYYILDNEPGIWHQTHRDVHPVGCTMDELKGKIVDYAAKIKAVDPAAQVVAPEEWGWTNYIYSGYDSQWGATHGYSSLPDRSSHGNMDMMPWLLDSLHKYDTANATKSLDVFSLHYYPQGGEYSDDTSTGMQLRRNRSTRSLWDPNYTDETWVNNNVQLIPRMKNWVNTYYPGLKTAITEYSWGADWSINGATAEADALGIFGREGLDIAAHWMTPADNSLVYNAVRMYRNLDGNGAGFGDISVSDKMSDPDNLSSFAAIRSADGAQTVMIINKALTANLPLTLTLANAKVTGAMQTWRLTSANAITRLPDTTIPTTATQTLTMTMPAQSITLLVIPGAVAAPSSPTSLAGVAGTGNVALTWTAGAGANVYNVKRSVTKGGPYSTVGNATATSFSDINVVNGTTYYYVVSATNGGGESANSNEVSATPMTANPGVVTGLFSTGLDGGGNPLADSSADGHYSLVSTPGGAGGAPFVTLQHFPIGNGLWMDDTAASKWISPIADEQKYTDAPGSYTYQTTFTITGDPSTVKVNGRLAGDDQVAAIVLNGQTVATNISNGFQTWSGFTLTTGLQAGTNTVQFVVKNNGSGPNPTGFRCELTSPNGGMGGAKAPAAPSGLTATGQIAQIALAWTAPSGAVSYNIKRSPTTGGPYTSIGTASAASYVDTGVAVGATYYYVVTAVGSTGLESVNSSEASAAPLANPGVVGLFSTGMDAGGKPLADGATDAHYSIVSAPAGMSGGTPYVTLQHFPVGNGLWMDDTAASKWISPIADEQKYTDAPGSYTYQTTFTINGDASKINITGRVAGDDQITTVVLNGVTIATNVSSTFQSWTNFALNTGLKTGTNTVQIVVKNNGSGPNPTGFRCEILSAK